jgi:predicted nucleic acid-binding protein
MAPASSEAPAFAVIFDTDVLIWYLRRHAGAALFVSAVPREERNLSLMTWLELLYGCRNRREVSRVLELITEAFAEVIPVSEGIGATGAQLMEQFVLARRPDPSDVLIAATALQRQEALATCNRKHFDFVPGLEVRVFRP